MSEPVPHDRPFPPDAFSPRPAPPDAARDARVAARRAADAARAGGALDKLLGIAPTLNVHGAYYLGWEAGYAASQLHHNRHYGVPRDPGRDESIHDDGGPCRYVAGCCNLCGAWSPRHPFRGHDGVPCLMPVGVGTSGYCDRPESDPVHRVDDAWADAWPDGAV